jgi:class 3 adenylate cyclase
MDLRVAPQADHGHDPSDPGAKQRAPSPTAPAAEPYALLGFELRRMARPNSKIVGDIEEVVLNRCVLAAVEVLTSAGAEIEVAGTPKRPVVEARFESKDAAPLAARSGVQVLAAVRQVQRAAENEFQVVGALTVGTASRGRSGARIESGGADVLLGRLRERAAPGQILLSEEARGAASDVVETVPARGAAGGSEDHPAPTYVLRGLK